MQCSPKPVVKLIVTLQILVSDCYRFCGALFRNRAALAAENLFLRKQLALFQEREKESQTDYFGRSLCVFQACSLLQLARRLGDR